MFHYDRGLKLMPGDLALDMRRRQPRGFISHAHADHMAKHELAVCTPETGRLYHLRCGERPVRELPYRQTLDWGPLRLTTYPAGHCLGSAMLLADDGRQTLLYTGDFKLGPAATAECAELPRADILVMECTFGDPHYKLTRRESVIDELISLVRRAIDRGCTPVIHAYVLGKAQEVTRLLTLAGIPVLQHPKVYEVSRVYRECGVELGDVQMYAGTPQPGWAVVVPPRTQIGWRLSGLGRCVTFAVTGWAMNPATRWRLAVDHAIPLSDHAGFDDLVAAVEQVSPQIVYCTHGPMTFVDHLRSLGVNAHVLDERACGAAAAALIETAVV